MGPQALNARVQAEYLALRAHALRWGQRAPAIVEPLVPYALGAGLLLLVLVAVIWLAASLTRSPDWLLPVGLWGYMLGAFTQIWQHWKARGLSDTSFRSLVLLMLGPGMVSLWAVQHGRPYTATATAVPVALAGLLVLLKARDFLHSRFKVLRRR